jgi:hypothetical protein
MCGDAWDYADQSGDAHFGEGWMMSYAVFDPGTAPTEGMAVTLDGVEYTLSTWTQLPPDEAPGPCRRGDRPGEGVFALVLTPR